MKKVYFVLNDLPILLYGGQLRSCNMIKFYKDNGFEVSGCYLNNENCTLDNSNFAKYVTSFFAFPAYVKRNVSYHGGQHKAYQEIAKDPDLVKQFVDHFEAFNPDIVVFEELWLTEFANEKVLNLSGKKIVYDSYNLEHKMVEDMAPNNLEAIRITKELEVKIAKKADLILACSASEYDFFNTNKNAQATVLLIPNGADIYTSKKIRPELLDAFKSEVTFSFISSSHKPNMDSLKKLFCFMPLFLPENAKLIIAGNVAHWVESFIEHLPSRDLWRQKIVALPHLSRDDIMLIYQLSSAIILPILYGDGTNIKTAEALLSSCFVIGTQKAFRGYENYRNEEGVCVVDNISQLRAKMREFATGDRKPQYHRNLEDELTWHGLLSKKLLSELKKL